MRTVAAILITLVTMTISAPASAQCYGDAAEMYGCGNQESANSGQLVRFGGGSEVILPDTGYAQRAEKISTDDLFTPQEQKNMLKAIVRGRTSGQSQAALNRAVNSAARPVRRIGTNTVGLWGR